LDTSVILKWLQDVYACEVVTFTADLGQGEEVEPARAKAKAAGIKDIYIEDLRKTLRVIMFFQCFVPIRFMKVNICWYIHCPPLDCQALD